MRLTLRTLLAYIDDRLPPEKAREIGLKIQKSPFATELADRVREVKRRRRIAAEQDKVPPVDANLIAEYLDDQLAPDVVARLEQRILASDALLAEVAAAHELLGMLRDPVPVERRLRDRLLSQDPGGTAPAAPTESFEREAASPNAAGWSETPSAPRGWLRWSPLLVAAGLCVWLASVFTDGRLLRPPADAVAVPGADQPASPAVQPPVPPVPPAVAAVAAAAGPAEPRAAANPAAVAANAAAGDTQPDAPVNPSIDPRPPVAAADPVPADAAVEPVAEFNVQLQCDNRTLLLANEKTGAWSTLLQIPGGDTVTTAPNITNSAPLLKNRWFGVPEPFEMKLRYESSGWLVRALGGSLLRLPPGQPGVQALSARLLVQPDSAMAWNDQQLPVLPLLWDQARATLTLQTAETRVGVQIVPATGSLKPAAADEPAVPADAASQTVALLAANCDYSVLITVLEGSAALQLAAAEPLPLASGMQVEWRVLDGSEIASLQQSEWTPASIPAWMLAPETEPVPEAAKIRSQLIKLLEAGGDPREAILPLATDSNPEAGLLAIEVLVLTRSVESLLNLFFEDLDEPVQRRVIDGLEALASSAAAAQQQIEDSLATRLPMAEAINIQRLLGGVSATTAASPETAQQLLAYLGDERLGVRTLAIYRLEQITGDRQNFYPAADASRRRDAIRRWQKWLDRQGGTLVRPLE